ncbi:phenoloxidase-activating factor 2 isoform X2 [Drosophila willistoni]|uniref:phenoloxidase-activating factor 2 isoform X2 n=1 Tax=Drosophila willistoni TaxID=7260 RepID=UPI000C26D41C|nr:phenoloxidase-activating factor 2 isoform X2 [Drosophila willistoni]
MEFLFTDKMIILQGFILLRLMSQICLAQDTSLDNLIADIFKTGENSISTTQSSSVLEKNINPKLSPKYQSCGNQRECVPRWLCANDTINSSGENIIDIRIDTGSPCKYLELCCDLPNKQKNSDVPLTPSETPNGCGYQNPNGVGFKITGAVNQEAEFGEFPWMVAILREENKLNLYECGGALIAPDIILTAAHCVHNKDANTLIVRAGEWDTQTKDEIIPHEDRYVKAIAYHERFNKGSLYNDIALLLVESPFSSQSNIQPVCLPEIGEVFNYNRCYATGWGKNKFGKDGEYQVILKKIDLPVVGNEICQSNLRETRLGQHFNLHDSFICAGGEKGKDTCKGDGGSPLVCPIKGEKNRFKSAGIVAWGIGCGEENIPGVYTNVAYLRPWINEKLKLWKIDSKYYTL